MKRKKKSFQEHGLGVKSLMTVVLCEGLVMLVHGVEGRGVRPFIVLAPQGSKPEVQYQHKGVN